MAKRQMPTMIIGKKQIAVHQKMLDADKQDILLRQIDPAGFRYLAKHHRPLPIWRVKHRLRKLRRKLKE